MPHKFPKDLNKKMISDENISSKEEGNGVSATIFMMLQEMPMQ